MNTTIYGLDIAKTTFQLYWVESNGKCFNRRFSRQKLIEFLAKREPGRVALEACGSAHWWARQLRSLGHEPVLLHPNYVRPFVQTNKTEATDAKAIWTAAQQPGMPVVAPKTEPQQSLLSLHALRQLRVKMRTMLVNQLRGMLFEFGVHFPRGLRTGLQEIVQHMADIEQSVPPMLFEFVHEQLQSIERLDEEIARLDQRINAWGRQNRACQTILAIPGIGMHTATAGPQARLHHKAGYKSATSPARASMFVLPCKPGRVHISDPPRRAEPSGSNNDNMSPAAGAVEHRPDACNRHTP